MSKKTQLARARNWRILQLRGIYSHAHYFAADRATQIRKLVDEELVALGAESETDKRFREHSEMLARYEEATNGKPA